jgi:hypothetical protein
MRFRFLLALLVICLGATGQTQTLSVARLMEWLRQPATAKENDQKLAAYLAGVKLTDRLDDRAIDSLRGQVLLGPKSMDALRNIRDESKNLPEAGAGGTSAAAKPLTVPTSEEQTAILEDARRYALEYSQKLPNFICFEREQRWAVRGSVPAGQEPDWRSQDTIVKKVTYFEQKEVEKVIQHNNTYTTQDMKSLGGSQSLGDFGTILRQIFEPRTAARFEWNRWGRVGQQLVMTFDFSVPLERSQYHLEVEGRGIVTAYHGSVRLDAKTHEVLRVFVEAENIPQDFPLKSASDTVDYAYQTISGRSFLLPVQADVRLGAGDYLTKNIKEFVNYSKYTAESSITFDDSALPPLPSEKPQETAVPGQPPPPAKKGG